MGGPIRLLPLLALVACGSQFEGDEGDMPGERDRPDGGFVEVDAGSDPSGADAAPDQEEEDPKTPEIPARCSHTFSDVSAGDDGAAAIRALYVNGIVNGCGENPLRFCPADDVLRRHFAIMLVGAMGESPSGAAVDAYFDDLAADGTQGYINRLYELGITNGCVTDTSFCPGDDARRDHTATFLVRAMSETVSAVDDDAYFDDLAGSLAYAGAINRIYELNITNGCGTRAYCPQVATKRWQAAAFLARAFDIDDSICSP